MSSRYAVEAAAAAAVVLPAAAVALAAAVVDLPAAVPVVADVGLVAGVPDMVVAAAMQDATVARAAARRGVRPRSEPLPLTEPLTITARTTIPQSAAITRIQLARTERQAITPLRLNNSADQDSSRLGRGDFSFAAIRDPRFGLGAAHRVLSIIPLRTRGPAARLDRHTRRGATASVT
jgi:hypothetical protein